jgi:hypothetical protein
VPFHLNVPHRLAHDSVDDIAHPQCLCYHLYMYNQNVFLSM